MKEQAKLETLEQFTEWAASDYHENRWKPYAMFAWSNTPARFYLELTGTDRFSHNVIEISKEFFDVLCKVWKTKGVYYIGQRTAISILSIIDKTAGQRAARIAAERKAEQELQTENYRRDNTRRRAKELIEQTNKFLADNKQYGMTLEQLTQIPDLEKR